MYDLIFSLDSSDFCAPHAWVWRAAGVVCAVIISAPVGPGAGTRARFLSLTLLLPK